MKGKHVNYSKQERQIEKLSDWNIWDNRLVSSKNEDRAKQTVNNQQGSDQKKVRWQTDFEFEIK